MLFKKIEEKSEEILREISIDKAPVPIEEVAKKLGIKIRRAPSKKFSGMLIRRDMQSLIGVNSDETPVRQRFTIAHELGHFLLHSNSKTFVEHRGNEENTVRDLKEMQANMFAAAILMPRKMLEKDLKVIAKEGILDEHVQFFATRYQVSEKAMNFRLINLGMFKR